MATVLLRWVETINEKIITINFTIFMCTKSVVFHYFSFYTVNTFHEAFLQLKTRSVIATKLHRYDIKC